MASARLQRCALTLNAYNYTIKYTSGKQQDDVDALRRFPLPNSLASTPTPAEAVPVIEHLSTISLTTSKVAKQTKQDFILSRVKCCTELGSPEGLNMREMDSSRYFNQRNELSIENNVLLWGNSIVIPFCF